MSERETSVLSSSAVMAAGTAVSRLSGFARTTLLAAALGTQLHADVFTIANTVPNMLYILLAGGVFNAVLVPQLVRAMKHDHDGGDAYTNRVITLAALFLAGTTALLVLAAPWVMRLYLDDAYFTAGFTEQRESAIAFARLCLPQVFFYGMFVLVGQVLNSRSRFGPMMWAPIANNVIAVLVLVVYLLQFGAASGEELVGGYTRGQELLLGLGSTLGIAVQLLILVPYLRAAGFRYRPRFDFRGTGLGHTFRLGAWTLGFVLVNQVAYTVVVRLASGGTAASLASDGTDEATGYTVYAGSFLLVMVPHAIATVSLATAVLPRLSRLATDADLRGLAVQIAATTRTALALILPFVLLLPAVALPLSDIVFGYGAAAETFQGFSTTLVAFGPGLVFFTVHYLTLRGFYALERNRTVFYVQCVVATTNVVLALLVVGAVSAPLTAPGLAVAYGGAYAVGAATSYVVLRRVVGPMQTPELVRFGVRMLIAAGLAGAAAYGWRTLVYAVWDGLGDGSKLQSLLVLGTTGLVDLIVLVGVSRALRITEIGEVTSLVTTRLRR